MLRGKKLYNLCQFSKFTLCSSCSFFSPLTQIPFCGWGFFLINIRMTSKHPLTQNCYNTPAQKPKFCIPIAKERKTQTFDTSHIKHHLIASAAVSRCDFILFLPARQSASFINFITYNNSNKTHKNYSYTLCQAEQRSRSLQFYQQYMTIGLFPHTLANPVCYETPRSLSI